MSNKYENKIRNLRNGGWYWINKKVLQLYSKKLKASGIAVYNVLASYVSSKNQGCFPTQSAIAEIIGMSNRTVIRRVRQLQELGLIRVEKRRGRNFYRLLRPEVTNKTQGGDKRDTPEVTPGNPNNNKLTRNNNNNVNEDKKIFNPNSLKGFKPETREELLALDIARELNDLKALPTYLSYARKYPESLLRMMLAEIREVPYMKIKKGRAALFNYLVKKYAQKASKNHRS